MSDSVTIEDSKGETFAEVIDVIGVSEVKKAFQKSIKEGSLHNWFKGSRSKGGKPGWVQVVSGKPCARQPGQKSTPKCVSSAKRASMTDAERKSAQRRKRAADPNQAEKTGAAKPTYVSTDKPKKKMSEEMKRDEYGDPIGGPKISKKQMKKNLMKNEPDEQHNTRMGESMEITEADKKGKGSGTKDACYHKVKSRYSVWPSAYASGALVKCRKVGAANWGNKSEEYKVTNEGMATPEKGTGKYYNEKKPTAKQLEARKKMFPAKTDAQKAATKKYDKIKELGNKGQHKAASDLYKEGVVEIQNSDGQTFAGVIDIVGPANMKTVTNENGVWQGTEQISEMKRDEYGDPIGGPKISKKQLKKNLAANTPDEKHTTTTSEAMNPAQQAAIAISKKQRIMDLMVDKKKKKDVKEENLDEKCWKGYEKKGMKTMFGKRYPNCVKKKVGESMVNWREDLNIEEGAAWTKKSGKSASGGLNEKGRKSYERDNPGSDLKAPSKKVGNPRRKSFCARMKGMKKKLTSAKTARDPDSRINKSLRAWNC